MLTTNGIPPKLTGRECEGLLCQQYWQAGKLISELDVLFIKCNEKWHELYFENCTVFWRPCYEEPVAAASTESDLFYYPLVDLADKYHLKGQVLVDYRTEPLANGSKITFLFENDDRLVVRCEDDETSIQHIKARATSA